MRSLVMLAPLLVSGAVALAQNPAPRVGFFAGINQSKVAGPASDISNHSGAAIGGYVVLPLGPLWSVQSGAAWTQKGWQRDEPGTRDLSVFKLTYLEIPVLLRYDFAPRDRVGALFFAGPGFGFRTACSSEATTNSTGQTLTASCDEIERISNGALAVRSFDVGAILGGGAHFAVGRGQLVATAQYEAGLKAVMNQGGNKNRTVTFGLGLELPFGRK